MSKPVQTFQFTGQTAALNAVRPQTDRLLELLEDRRVMLDKLPPDKRHWYVQESTDPVMVLARELYVELMERLPELEGIRHG